MELTPSRVTFLWILWGLFFLRVLGQMLVAFLDVKFLPAMDEWYSGLLSYPYLLPAQIVIIGLLLKVNLDLNRRSGFFARSNRVFRGVLYFGYIYLVGMIVRYVVRMSLYPEERWFGGTIPIVFHWVLATYVILFGLHHRARPESK